MKLVYSQQNFTKNDGNKDITYRKWNQIFDKILTEAYIPKIYKQKDELGCLRLPAGSLVCPVDYKPVTNKGGKKVTAVKYSNKKDNIRGSRHGYRKRSVSR